MVTDSTTPAASTSPILSEKSFVLLELLHQAPLRKTYEQHHQEFVEHVERPFQQQFQKIRDCLPSSMLDTLETRNWLFGQILKNDWNVGGAFDFYWGAYYPKNGRRSERAQLFLQLTSEQLFVGFRFGEYSEEARLQFFHHCQFYESSLPMLLYDSLSDPTLQFGRDTFRPEGQVHSEEHRTNPQWDEWLKNPRALGPQVVKAWTKDSMLAMPELELAQTVATCFQQLFPLVVLASCEDPLPRLVSLHAPSPDKVVNQDTRYTLTECVEDLCVPKDQVQAWIRNLDRTKQAIFYGPYGSGSAVIAQKLTQHLISGEDGFSETISFYPGYSYKDGVQQLYRDPQQTGSQAYHVVDGDFVRFCEQARRHSGRCVLIIEHINWAGIGEVFGEVMRALEHRENDVRLKSGKVFTIPWNVYIIGTLCLGEAEKLSWLSTCGLFTCFALSPDYDRLRSFHAHTPIDVEPLIQILQEINQEMKEGEGGLGVAPFLRINLDVVLEDIWKTEIVPYLENVRLPASKIQKFHWDNMSLVHAEKPGLDEIA